THARAPYSRRAGNARTSRRVERLGVRGRVGCGEKPACPALVGSLARGIWSSPGAEAADTGAGGFKRINPSVVTVRTRERDMSAESQGELVTLAGLASGVLTSVEGTVLTRGPRGPRRRRDPRRILDGSVVGARVMSAAQEAGVSTGPRLHPL